MANYKRQTRQRVLDYLKTRRKPIVRKRLQFLGMDSKQVNLDSLKTILEDLEKEGIITIERHKFGKQTISLIEVRR